MISHDIGEIALRNLRDGNDGPVLALLEQGADPNQPCASGFTALYCATGFNRPTVVRALLRFGADPNTCDEKSNGLTALMRAAQEGHLEIMRLLLDAGAEPDKTDAFGSTALTQGLNRNRFNNTAWIDLLVGRGANVNHRTQSGVTPLIQASMRCGPDVLEKLLTLGADHHASFSGEPFGGKELAGWNALMVAIFLARLENVRILLRCGADPHAINRTGESALDIAEKYANLPSPLQRKGHPEIWALLRKAHRNGEEAS